jgi:hypothetical protein
MYERGEISKATLEEWTHGVNAKKLPEKVKNKTRKKATKRKR